LCWSAVVLEAIKNEQDSAVALQPIFTALDVFANAKFGWSYRRPASVGLSLSAARWVPSQPETITKAIRATAVPAVALMAQGIHGIKLRSGLATRHGQELVPPKLWLKF